MIAPGKLVELAFDIYTVGADGKDELAGSVTKDNPERIIFGVTEGVIRPLEQALEGARIGDQFNVYAKADEAFGPVHPDNIVELDKSVFEVDGKFDADNVKAGAVLPMMTAEGMRLSGVVTKVTDDKVTMDFNHPLAGKDVHLVGSVVAVRDATEEDIHPAGGCCGGGCHNGDCGDNCDCSSKDSCDCGDKCDCNDKCDCK